MQLLERECGVNGHVKTSLECAKKWITERCRLAVYNRRCQNQTETALPTSTILTEYKVTVEGPALFVFPPHGSKYRTLTTRQVCFSPCFLQLKLR